MKIVKPDAIATLLPIEEIGGLFYDSNDTIEISDCTWRPEAWPDFVEYFTNRPEGMTALELWEFGATSMLNALMSLTGEGK
jgi:hypothetical protein